MKLDLETMATRRYADYLKLEYTGTLGVLLSAKERRHLPVVKPALDEWIRLQFRISPATRAAVLKLAGESE